MSPLLAVQLLLVFVSISVLTEKAGNFSGLDLDHLWKRVKLFHLKEMLEFVGAFPYSIRLHFKAAPIDIF